MKKRTNRFSFVRWPRKKAHAPPEIEEVAAIAQRLAVLLAAGVIPAAAWRYLAEDSTNPVLRAGARAADAGENVATAISRASASLSPGLRQGWKGLAAAWSVAIESGAPLSQCLRELAGAFRSLGETERDIGIALAGPKATARLVMALPLVGILFGAGLGFDTLHTLFATGPGLVCLFGGAGLLVAAASWNASMIRRATPRDRTPGLSIDLLAVAMSGGASVDRARSLVIEAMARYRITGDTKAADSVIGLARRAGVPAGELLSAEAEQLRREARAAGQRGAAALAVRLMVPLGVCVLPAFLLLGVAPLLIAILSSTVSNF